MTGEIGSHCPYRAAVEALAAAAAEDDGAAPAQKRSTHEHLETCRACCELYAARTAGRFPLIRDYLILERIGKGGFGVVYKAIHLGKQRVEALKVLITGGGKLAQYFENEVHLAARLRHPNIATLYEANLKNPPLHFAMEFVEGQRFDEYCRTGHRTLEQRIELIRTVARAIGYAHGHGVVHRDLKPQNILIDPDGVPRIVDFGIAKRLDVETAPAAGSPDGAVGTPGYIAPEQFAGRPTDHRADIYSLGALLFHATTGEPARLARDPDVAIEYFLRHRLARAHDLAAIIARCVAQEPDQRYESCERLADDLDRYLRGQSIAARTSAPLSYRLLRHAAYQIRHHPVVICGLLTILSAGALTAILEANEARRAAGVVAREVVLVGVRESTRDAIRSGRIGSDLPALDLANPKSLRVLHGRLMEALAAARPSVVVWDYFFPDEQPAFDPAFVAGIEALRAAATPVVVAADRFDINGEPITSPLIRDAACGFGTIRVPALTERPGEIVVPLCILRGFSPPIPSLAVAAFAAARFPSATPELRPHPDGLEIRYRLRSAVAGTPRWLPQSDRLAFVNTDHIRQDDRLETGDVLLLARVAADFTPARVVPYEDVLAADEPTLRSWFADRRVVIGQMIEGQDQYPTADGRRVFGCEVHARMLDALLSRGWMTRFTRRELLLRTALACSAGMILGVLLVRRAPKSLTPAAAVAGIGVIGGVAAAVLAGRTVTQPWAVEAAIVLTAAWLCGGLGYAVAAARRRQLQLVPDADWAPGESTLPATVIHAASPTAASGQPDRGTGPQRQPADHSDPQRNQQVIQ